MGSKDGTVVRALTSHQCDPSAIFGMSLFLVPTLLQGFSPGSVFLLPRKPTSSNFNLTGIVDLREDQLQLMWLSL